MVSLCGQVGVEHSNVSFSEGGGKRGSGGGGSSPCCASPGEPPGDPKWGRRPREGEEAEGHPSLILLDYLICTPDPRLVRLKILTGRSYLPM